MVLQKFDGHQEGGEKETVDVLVGDYSFCLEGEEGGGRKSKRFNLLSLSLLT